MRTTGEAATSLSRTAAPYTLRSSPTACRTVVGAGTLDRSLAQACTSDGRTCASFRPPRRVPSMCSRIIISVRRAVVGR